MYSPNESKWGSLQESYLEGISGADLIDQVAQKVLGKADEVLLSAVIESLNKNQVELAYFSIKNNAQNDPAIIQKLLNTQFFQLISYYFKQYQNRKASKSNVSEQEEALKFLIQCRGNFCEQDINQALCTAKYSSVDEDELKTIVRQYSLYSAGQSSPSNSKNSGTSSPITAFDLGDNLYQTVNDQSQDLKKSSAEIFSTGNLQEHQNYLASIFKDIANQTKRDSYLQALKEHLLDLSKDHLLTFEFVLTDMKEAWRNENTKENAALRDFLMQILSVIIKNFKIVDAFQPYFIELDEKRNGNKETFRDYLDQKATVNVSSGNFKNRFTFLTGILSTIVVAEKKVVPASQDATNFNRQFRSDLGKVIDDYNKERSIKSKMGTRLRFYQPAMNDVLSFEASVPVKEREKVLVRQADEMNDAYNKRVLKHVDKLLMATQSLKESKLYQLFNIRSLMRHLNTLVMIFPSSILQVDGMPIKLFLQKEIKNYNFFGTMIFFSSRVQGLLNIMQVLLKSQDENVNKEALKQELNVAVSLYKSDIISVANAPVEQKSEDMPFRRTKSWSLFSDKSLEEKQEEKRLINFPKWGKIARAALFGVAVSIASSVDLAVAGDKERDLNDNDKTETVLRDTDDDKQRFRRNSI